MKSFTQKEIREYLLANPIEANVHTGDLTDLNNQDYIFFDYLSEDIIGSDNTADYSTNIQFTVACKDFENRKTLVNYIKQQFVCSITYEDSEEHEYYLARMSTWVILNG